MLHSAISRSSQACRPHLRSNTLKARPSIVVTVPPASSTMSTPAAMSQGFSRYSQ